MTHLTPDELVDAMEGELTPAQRIHLSACDDCRHQLDDLRDVLGDAKQVSVPEPSPLFWPRFSQRVNAAIDNERAPERGWPQWLRWQVLLPVGAVAMIILALMISVPKDSTDAPAAQVAPVALDAPADTWQTVADLVGELDLETASASGVIAPGIADRAVLELTAEEQQELSRLLHAELTRAKS